MNSINPFSRLRLYLASLGLPANAAFFVPCFGLGDRLRFLSYLHLFDLFNGCKSYLVFEEGSPQDILGFYPELQQERTIIVPSGVMLKPLDLHLHAMGDDRPGPQKIYFTWHKQYLGGQSLSWEQINHESVTHDLMVKQILGVPAVFTPKRIHTVDASGEPEPVIYLAPFSVSNPGLPQEFWLGLADALTAKGLRVVCNGRTNGARNVWEHQQYDELLRRFAPVDCGLDELVARVGRSRGIVTVRSGLSDLFSLTEMPQVSLTHNRIGSFWKLPVSCNRQAEINVDRQSIQETIAQVVPFLAG
jgi:hypothetical protein